MRVLHFSDVHVTLPMGALPWRELWNKRLLGVVNSHLRRAKHFREAREKLAALAEFASAQRIDLVLCTGDYTVVGTHPELQAARAAVDGLTRRPEGFCTLPGNHDVYMPDTLRDRRFDRYFGEFMHTDTPEHSVDGRWPLVRFVGEQVAVVAVQSTRPNPQPWRSSGRIRDAELDALDQVLRDPRVRQRFVFVITHYAPRRPDGSPDKRSHGLENADALLACCGQLPRGALLHGHIHWRYHLTQLPGTLPIFGAGSATYAGREGVWVFDVSPTGVRACPGGWSGGGYQLDESAAVELDDL